MPTLKCTKCNKEFKTGFISASKVIGIAGVWVGIVKAFPIWPFQTSIFTTCPNCNEKTKLLVLASKPVKVITTLIIILVIVGLLSLLFVL